MPSYKVKILETLDYYQLLYKINDALYTRVTMSVAGETRRMVSQTPTTFFSSTHPLQCDQWPPRKPKFIYADDVCLRTQVHTFAELERSLTSDMARIEEYRRCWHLKPNVTCQVSFAFIMLVQHVNWMLFWMVTTQITNVSSVL